MAGESVHHSRKRFRHGWSRDVGHASIWTKAILDCGLHGDCGRVVAEAEHASGSGSSGHVARRVGKGSDYRHVLYRFRQRQNVMVVLEQDHRASAESPGERSPLRAEIVGNGGLVRVRMIEETDLELDLEDRQYGCLDLGW